MGPSLQIAPSDNTDWETGRKVIHPATRKMPVPTVRRIHVGPHPKPAKEANSR